MNMEEKEKEKRGKGYAFQQVNQQFNIQSVGVINNDVEKVDITFNNGVRQENAAPKEAKKEASSLRENMKEPMENVDITPIRREILNYVSRVAPMLADEWKNRYIRMWEEILDLKVVAASVYNHGKQQDTNFNRNLVANIIYYLVKRGCFGDEKKYNASQFAVDLGHDKEESVRASLRCLPPKEIVSRLDRYFE